MAESWPPVYDADDLGNLIHEISGKDGLIKNFYASEPRERICQGDIIRLEAEIPLLHSDGQPALFGDATFWLIIGNTCDIDRTIEDVTWSQIVPLIDITDQITDTEELASLKRYRYAKRFYLPPWSNAVKDKHHVADFLRPVTVHKHALTNIANTETKLSFEGWILLHSCLVRFLARDDGRFN